MALVYLDAVSHKTDKCIIKRLLLRKVHYQTKTRPKIRKSEKNNLFPQIICLIAYALVLRHI